ncbi:MAG: hypothetical protein J6D11_08115 [Clostridia bacterium]|nr:hypothetical protein [Clostridia bacterium]
MNIVWSKYMQGIKTLYCSRKLRFNDVFATQYKSFFDLDESKPLKILEIGCGPGEFARLDMITMLPFSLLTEYQILTARGCSA